MVARGQGRSIMNRFSSLDEVGVVSTLIITFKSILVVSYSSSSIPHASKRSESSRSSEFSRSIQQASSVNVLPLIGYRSSANESQVWFGFGLGFCRTKSINSTVRLKSFAFLIPSDGIFSLLSQP